MPSAKPAVLRMDGVSKRWRGRERPVLGGIDIDLDPGTVFWLGGGNGAGKTTLLRIAAGLLAPDAGAVAIAGFDVAGQPRAAKRRLGFMAAGSSGLYARLTALQQLDFWARTNFVDPARRSAVIADAVERFGCRAYAQRRLDRISMGERQRVRLAMAFAHEPDLVLLDEPRNSLDAAGQEILAQEVRRHAQRGGAVLWCAPTGEAPPPGAAVHLLSDGLLQPR